MEGWLEVAAAAALTMTGELLTEFCSASLVPRLQSAVLQKPFYVAFWAVLDRVIVGVGGWPGNHGDVKRGLLW